VTKIEVQVEEIAMNKEDAGDIQESVE